MVDEDLRWERQLREQIERDAQEEKELERVHMKEQIEGLKMLIKLKEKAKKDKKKSKKDKKEGKKERKRSRSR